MANDIFPVIMAATSNWKWKVKSVSPRVLSAVICQSGPHFPKKTHTEPLQRPRWQGQTNASNFTWYVGNSHPELPIPNYMECWFLHQDSHSSLAQGEDAIFTHPEAILHPSWWVQESVPRMFLTSQWSEPITSGAAWESQKKCEIISMKCITAQLCMVWWFAPDVFAHSKFEVLNSPR